MRTKLLALIAGVLVVASLGSCQTRPPPPDDSGADGAQTTDVAVRSGNVTAPGTTIVSAGNTYDGASGLSTATLVGIVKDGQAYLYHPALGSVALSEETSRRAVGMLILDLEDDSGTSKASQAFGRSLAVGDSTTLSTGVDVKRLDASTYEVSNPKKRWVAVKRGSIDPPTFIPPRKGVSLSVYDLGQLFASDFELNSVARITVQAQSIETFGAMSRANPISWLTPSMRDKAREALDHDTLLFLRVNAVDFVQFAVEGYDKILGLVPGKDCLDAAALSGLRGAFEQWFVGVITGDEELARQFRDKIAANFTQKLAQCGCAVATAGACEALNEFIKIVSAMSWIVDDALLGQWDVYRNDAYASLEHAGQPTVAGSIVAWGEYTYGGQVLQSEIPMPNSSFVAVAAGEEHSLGLKADNSIVAWGKNTRGECNVPSPNSGFIAVAAGWQHSLGLKSDGSIVAWGQNDYGQRNVPSPNSGFVAIAAGGGFSLGLKADGSIVAWGTNNDGRCEVPVPNSGFVAIAAGGGHSLSLKVDGSIVAWGANWDGAIDVPSPNSGFVAVAAGGEHSLGLKADGSIVAWGAGEPGQPFVSGQNVDFGQSDVPAPNSGFIAVAAGGYHSLGLKANGSIVAWGWNDGGQCDIPAPNSGFVAVAAGGDHSLGLKGQ
jgi:hypothetical protein